jgi:hypothetical protein
LPITLTTTKINAIIKIKTRIKTSW